MTGMTKEEAAEIILDGPYWLPCPNECDGGFFYFDKTYQGHSACNMCSATGKVIGGAYKQACLLLGIEVPKVPRDLVETIYLKFYGPKLTTRLAQAEGFCKRAIPTKRRMK